MHHFRETVANWDGRRSAELAEFQKIVGFLRIHLGRWWCRTASRRR